jgi:hypothetical protein
VECSFQEKVSVGRLTRPRQRPGGHDLGKQVVWLLLINQHPTYGAIAAFVTWVFSPKGSSRRQHLLEEGLVFRSELVETKFP